MERALRAMLGFCEMQKPDPHCTARMRGAWPRAARRSARLGGWRSDLDQVVDARDARSAAGQLLGGGAVLGAGGLAPERHPPPLGVDLDVLLPQLRIAGQGLADVREVSSIKDAIAAALGG